MMAATTTILFWTAIVLMILSQTVASFVIHHNVQQLSCRGHSLDHFLSGIRGSSYPSRSSQSSSSSVRLFSSSTQPQSTIETEMFEDFQRYRNFLSVPVCIELYKNDVIGKDSNGGVFGWGGTVHFLEVTWFHKGDRNGRQEFLEGPRIKGSNYFDIMDIAMNGDVFPSENPNNLYTMFPPVQLLSSCLDKMGIPSTRQVPHDDDEITGTVIPSTTIVIYGRSGTLFAPRIWYMLKKYYDNNPYVHIRIMDGPFEEWIELGGPIDTNSLSGEPQTTKEIWARDLVAEYLEESSYGQQEYPMEKVAQDNLVEKTDVLKIVEESDDPLSEEERSLLIIDTRGSSYKKKGHIPSAIHVPYSSLTMVDNPLRLRPREELISILKDILGFDIANTDDDGGDSDDVDTTAKRILLTCGSAVSVCHMALVLDEFRYPYEPMIYDGSWNEWGSDPSTPKAGV